MSEDINKQGQTEQLYYLGSTGTKKTRQWCKDEDVTGGVTTKISEAHKFTYDEALDGVVICEKIRIEKRDKLIDDEMEYGRGAYRCERVNEALSNVGKDELTWGDCIKNNLMRCDGNIFYNAGKLHLRDW